MWLRVGVKALAFRQACGLTGPVYVCHPSCSLCCRPVFTRTRQLTRRNRCLAPAVAFAQGTPFRPFEQLLAVLPSASAKLLPSPFRSLMLEPGSPIVDFYPDTFEVGPLCVPT